MVHLQVKEKNDRLTKTVRARKARETKKFDFILNKIGGYRTLAST